MLAMLCDGLATTLGKLLIRNIHAKFDFNLFSGSLESTKVITRGQHLGRSISAKSGFNLPSDS